MLCQLCSQMSLPRLVDLAKRDFRSGFFPAKEYYHHHVSFQELEECATKDGEQSCPLCRLILDSFSSAEHDATNPQWPVPTLTNTGKAGGAGAPAKTSTPKTAGTTEAGTRSMRDVARQLAQSDVRIALRSRHTATGAFLEHVKTFDLLAVRLGDRLELGDPLRVPDLMLVLRVPSSIQSATDYKTLEESLPLVGGYRIGCSTPDAHLGSAGNFALARSWLDDCTQNHTHCSTTAHTKLPPRLPTRVIDVTTTPARIVHSVDINKGRPDQGCAEYVALSHCWGRPAIETLLTSKTLTEYCHALPESDLPANFQDAITVTRSLGIPYVWIDSLCIIQDSVADWRYESVRMGALYSRATFSLLAMAADQAAAGILKEVPSSPSSAAATRVPFGPVTFSVSPIFQDSESLRQLSESAPLSVRGWTLQEVVFSARILFYGAHQIYWFCSQGGYKSAESLPDGILYPHNKYPSMASEYYDETKSKSSTLLTTTSSSLSSTEAILTDFYHFIASYAQRTLTYGTDKFPAVSSFAQNVAGALRSQAGTTTTYAYMAGVWSGDFRRGLLFCPDGMHAPHVLRENEKDGLYRAPSWSWAVTDAPIVFLGAQTPPTEMTNPLNCQLVSWSSTLRDPNNAFGAVDDARIVVKGRVCRLRMSSTHFIGPYTWDKDDELGSAWFDDRPVIKGQPLETANGNCIVFEGTVDGDDEDTFLCTYYAPGKTVSTEEKQTVVPDSNDYEEQEYTLLMVDLGQADKEETKEKAKKTKDIVGSDDDDDDDGGDDDDNDFDDDDDFDDDWDMTDKLIHCLILKEISTDVYERVGVLILDWKCRSRVDKWREQTMTLV